MSEFNWFNCKNFILYYSAYVGIFLNIGPGGGGGWLNNLKF